MVALFAGLPGLSGAGVKYTNSPSLSKVVKGDIRDCAGNGTLQVPMIAWGGDIATVHANGDSRKTAKGSIFGGKGLDISLFREDNFAKQVQAYLSCKTPFLRGTMGMINMAGSVTENDPRTKMVVIYKLTDSAGGDALVVKGKIKKPSQLKGATIAVQRYGPHVDYLTTVLTSSGLSIKDVNIKWVEDLIELDDNSNSPAKAFREDSSIDAAFVIIPDALALTSGGGVGTGSEDSVKDAHILMSTKTADKVIMDVYAVRSDYLKANREKVEAFTHGLLIAGEKVKSLFANRGKPEFKKTITASAEMLLDSKSATEDTAAMYGDARHVGYSGNVEFFGKPELSRSFGTLTSQVQSAFVSLGLLSKKFPLNQAKWDYTRLAAGLSDTKGVVAPRFDKKAVTKLVTKKQQKGTLQEGELFSFEVYFQPNQNSFPADMYSKAFNKVMELTSIYGGALLTIEGHSDPSNYLRKKVKNSPREALNRIKQSARNLSHTRANALKESLINYANTKNVTLDPSQFAIIGHGIMQPNTPGCKYDGSGDISKSCYPKNKQEWENTRRVVFRLIQIEAEADVFQPL